MLGHVAKKQRVDRVQDSHEDGYLSGIKVSLDPHGYFFASSMHTFKLTRQAPSQPTATGKEYCGALSFPYGLLCAHRCICRRAQS